MRSLSSLSSLPPDRSRSKPRQPAALESRFDLCRSEVVHSLPVTVKIRKQVTLPTRNSFRSVGLSSSGSPCFPFFILIFLTPKNAPLAAGEQTDFSNTLAISLLKSPIVLEPSGPPLPRKSLRSFSFGRTKRSLFYPTNRSAFYRSGNSFLASPIVQVLPGGLHLGILPPETSSAIVPVWGISSFSVFCGFRRIRAYTFSFF